MSSSVRTGGQRNRAEERGRRGEDEWRDLETGSGKRRSEKRWEREGKALPEKRSLKSRGQR